MFSLLLLLSMLKLPLMAERECAPLIRSRCHIQMYVAANKLYNAGIRSVLEINN